MYNRLILNEDSLTLIEVTTTTQLFANFNHEFVRNEGENV